MLLRRLQEFLTAQQSGSLWASAFILLLVLLPLPFGSNRPWASDLFAVVSGILLVSMLWSERHAPSQTDSGTRRRLWASAALVTLVVVWSFVQIVPFTPAAWHHPIWQEAATILGPTSGAISVDPGQFPESLIRLVAYIATFLLAFAAARNVTYARRIIHALAFAGVAYAAYGIVAMSAGGDTILWYKKWAYGGFLTSTFVNKNSYAAYAGLGLLCCIAYVLHYFKDFTVKDAVLARQSKVMGIIVSLRLRDYAVLLFPVLLLAALALTGSRAGVASTILGSVAFLVALAINKKWPVYQWVALLVFAAILFLTFVGIGGEALLVRVSGEALSEDTATRLAAYKLTMQAIQDNPWLGFGLGTFDSAFRLYRDATLPLWFHHAHNDYLEMILDLGIPAASFLFIAIGLVVSCSITGIRQRKRDGVYPAIAIGASVLVASHALVDFSMHIPAIAATYAALLGVGAAQSSSSRTQQPTKEQTSAKPSRQQQKSPASVRAPRKPAAPAPVAKPKPAPVPTSEVKPAPAQVTTETVPAAVEQQDVVTLAASPSEQLTEVKIETTTVAVKETADDTPPTDKLPTKSKQGKSRKRSKRKH